jgi:hypothetical protein
MPRAHTLTPALAAAHLAQNVHRYNNLVSGTEEVESCLMEAFAEHLNAEVVLETVRRRLAAGCICAASEGACAHLWMCCPAHAAVRALTAAAHQSTSDWRLPAAAQVRDVSMAIEWLKTTFMWQRVRRKPAHYQVGGGLGLGTRPVLPPSAPLWRLHLLKPATQPRPPGATAAAAAAAALHRWPAAASPSWRRGSRASSSSGRCRAWRSTAWCVQQLPRLLLRRRRPAPALGAPGHSRSPPASVLAARLRACPAAPLLHTCLTHHHIYR